jgi:hypothetical protein
MSAVTAFTVTEAPLSLEPVTADPFIDALEREETPATGHAQNESPEREPAAAC